MPTFNASPDTISQHLHVLCREIGNRLAATEAERRAAHYFAEQMEALGMSDVTFETFPFHVWGYETARVDLLSGDGRSIECIPVANSRPTPAEGIEAEVVYVDHATETDLAMNDVEGKLLLIWGLSDGAEALQMLQASGAAGLLWVDDRLPMDWPVSAGTPYAWRDIVTLPQVTVPYWDALEIARMDAPRARLVSDAWREEGEAVNVFADLPGESDEMVHMTAHIDTVIVGTGAEDDGSGIAAMLEAARMLVETGERPERTIRFCGFGAEEQLSEGARVYVERRPEAADCSRLVVNLDSVAALTGRNQLMVVGPQALREVCEQMTAPESPVLSGEVREHVSPFSDMFPFNARGCPSVWLHRMNQAGTRYFHHSHLDDLQSISPRVIADHANAAAHLAHEAAFGDPPLARAIPDDQMTEVRKMAEKYFG